MPIIQMTTYKISTPANHLLYMPFTGNYNDVEGNTVVLTGSDGIYKTTSTGEEYLSVDGNTLFTVDSLSGLEGDGDWTVSCWLRITSTSLNVVRGYGSDGTKGTGLIINNLQVVIFIYGGDISTGIYINPDEWTNIIFTHTNGTNKIYINGSLVDTRNLDYTFKNSTLFLLRDKNGSNPMRGNFDELIIDNKTWTAQEVQNYYNSTKDNYIDSWQYYQEVEWIENTSSSWISTGLLSGAGYKIDFKFYTSSSTVSDQTIVGGNPNSSTCLYFGVNYGYNNGIYWNYKNARHDIFNKIYVGNTYEATSIIRNGYQEMILDGVTVGSDSQSVSTPSPGAMTIFGRGGSSNRALIKLYYMKIYDDSNVLIRDFVPCYRNIDGEIGLYDLVNNMFHSNSGSGTFTKGPDVN